MDGVTILADWHEDAITPSGVRNRPFRKSVRLDRISEPSHGRLSVLNRFESGARRSICINVSHVAVDHLARYIADPGNPASFGSRVVYEHRGVAGEHIVRVACSRPARRVTCGPHAFDLDFHRPQRRRPSAGDLVDGNGDGNADRHQRTPSHAEQARRSPLDALEGPLLEWPARPRTTTYGRRERTRAAPPASRALRVALRPPYGRPLTPETTTAPQPPTPPGRHLTAPATAPSNRQHADPEPNTQRTGDDSHGGRHRGRGTRQGPREGAGWFKFALHNQDGPAGAGPRARAHGLRPRAHAHQHRTTHPEGQPTQAGATSFPLPTAFDARYREDPRRVSTRRAIEEPAQHSWSETPRSVD